VSLSAPLKYICFLMKSHGVRKQKEKKINKKEIHIYFLAMDILNMIVIYDRNCQIRKNKK